jgi:phage major head subunit gpT-like protein
MLLIRDNAEKLFVQFSAQFQAAFDATPVYYPSFATEMPSSTDVNLYHWIAQLPGMRKWVGDRQMNNVALRDYEVRNEPYEDAISLDKFKVMNDQYGAFGPTVDAFGQAVRRWPDEIMAAVVEAGNSTVCYDGQYFFDVDHPVSLDDASLSTYSNNLVGAAYNIANDPIGVWQALSEAASAFKGDSGKPLAVQLDGLMVPPQYRRYAVQAAKAELIPQAIKNVAGNENVGGAAVSNIYQGDFTVIVNPYLSANAVYGLCLNRAVKPFIWQLRQAPTFVNLVDPTLPNMFKERAFIYGAEGQGAGDYSLPFLAVRAAAS